MKIISLALRKTVCQLLAVLLAASIASAQSSQSRQQSDQPFYRVKPAPKASSPAPKQPSFISQQYEREGIIVDFSMRSIKGDNGLDAGLIAGSDATVSFTIKDKLTDKPVTGLHPSAWINSRPADRATGEAECKDKVRTLMGGLLSARADIDLNNYLLLTLNHDNTITFINPQVSFNITKLESIITLPGAGADWALSSSKDFLYLTMPDTSSVAVINTATRKLVSTISTGEKSRPFRIAIQPDGRLIWVGLDNSPSVAVIDTATNRLARIIETGAGLHLIAFSPDGRFAYVTNSSSDTVSAIDTKTLTKTSDIAVGKTPLAITASSASNLIYVAALNGGAISVINPDKQSVVKDIPLKRGVVAIRFDPSGRYGFVVNQIEGLVSIIDASNNSVTAESEVVKGADQVTFTRLYAYIRGTESEKFSLIELNEVRKGKFAPVNIQAGRLAPNKSPGDINVADMIQPTPEGNSVMIANGPDQMIYYYVEGMMVPMGTFQNYKRRPRGLMIVDRSLSETAPGVYSAQVKLRRAGAFDVPFIVDQPRLINCFEAKIGDSPLAEKDTPDVSTVVEALFKGSHFKAGETVSLKFKINDSVTRQSLKGLADVQVLVFEPPGIWQNRVWAKETGDGVYEAEFAFPHAGMFRVMTQINSRGVRFADLSFTSVPVIEPDTKGGTK